MTIDVGNLVTGMETEPTNGQVDNNEHKEKWIVHLANSVIGPKIIHLLNSVLTVSVRPNTVPIMCA